MRYGWMTCCCIVLLLLVLFSGAASSRRAGRRGGSNKGPPSQGEAHSKPKSSSNKQSQAGGGHGAKMAGLAAAGAAMGYGLNSLSKSQRGRSSSLAGREKGLSSSAVVAKGHSQALKRPGLLAFSLLLCGFVTSLF